MSESPRCGSLPVVVIGGGPAGMAAAAAAVREGAQVTLVDAAPLLGGQYWRHGAKDEAPGAPAPRWHHGWSTFQGLRSSLEQARGAGRLTVLSSTQAWALRPQADGEFVVRTSRLPEAEPGSPAPGTDELRARSVVLAPGAYDRQLPVDGWTLPGVMAAGGLQAFIKVQEASPGQRVLLAGTGPFLLAAAASVLQAGAQVVAVCESADLTGWVPRGASAALVPSKGVEGAQYAALLARHRVPYLTRTVITRIEGEDRVRAVQVGRADRRGRALPGAPRRFEDVDVVGLGWGFVPQAELLLQTGAATRMDVDGSLVGTVDHDQATNLPGLYLAGEITGVTGATGAVAEGEIAGAAAAHHAAGAADGAGPFRAPRAAVLARARHRTFAQAMHYAHPVPQHWQDRAADDTLLCRCEEVTMGEAIAARDDLDLHDARSLKGSTRVAMGLCQGRICGFAASCLAGSGTEPRAVPALEDAIALARRPLGLPLTLGALAAEAPSEVTVATEPLPSSEDRT